MDVREVLAAQTEMYGEPLGQRCGRLLAAYGISQARLAAVVGLSPPMLSQLMSGQRAKISNPAVYGRLVRLEEMAGAVAGDPAAREAALEEVRRSRPTLHTGQVADTGPGDAAEQLARSIPSDVLYGASQQVSDPGLAAVLRRAAELAAVPARRVPPPVS